MARSALTAASVQLSVCFAFVIGGLPGLGELPTLTRKIFSCPADFQTNTMLVYVRDAALLALQAVGPLLAALIALASAAELVQVGWNLSFSPLAPKLARLNPAHGLKRISGLGQGETPGRPLLEAGKHLLLLGLLLIAASPLAASRLRESYRVVALPEAARQLAAELAAAMLPLLIAASGIELLLVRRRRRKRLAMDFEEYLREMRETEGSAEHRALRRRLHQELSLQRMFSRLRRARVLVVGRR